MSAEKLGSARLIHITDSIQIESKRWPTLMELTYIFVAKQGAVRPLSFSPPSDESHQAEEPNKHGARFGNDKP